MKTKVIILEFRNPTKKEKGLYGSTYSEDGISRIFINAKQSNKERIDTLFHELAHAVIHLSGSEMPDDEEERIARLVGNVAEPCFRRYGK